MSNEITVYEDKLLKPLTLIEQQIVSLYTDGVDIKDIALELGTTASAIRRVLNKPEIKNVTNQLILDYGLALKAEKLRLLNKIVEEKLKEIDNSDDKTIADATNKDVVDLIKIMDDMQKEKEKKDLGTSSNNIYLNLLNNIMEQ